MAKKINVKKSAPQKSAPVAVKTCNAIDVGHRSCKCGGPDCGANSAVFVK
jgi:hypothetical protein